MSRSEQRVVHDSNKEWSVKLSQLATAEKSHLGCDQLLGKLHCPVTSIDDFVSSTQLAWLGSSSKKAVSLVGHDHLIPAREPSYMVDN